jgi:hypothetical protein
MEPLTPEQTQERFQLLLEKAKRGIVLSAGDTEFLHRHKDKERWKKNLSEVALVFNVYASAMMRWKEINPDAFQKTPLGYDLDAIKAVRKQFLSDGNYTRLNDGDEVNVEGVEDVATLKARKIFLECKNLEIKNKKAESILIEVDKVLIAFRAICYAVKDKFSRVPSELAYEVSGVTPAEAEQRMREKIDKICQELSVEDYSKLEDALTTPTDDGDDLEVKPAEPEKPKPKRQKK